MAKKKYIISPVPRDRLPASVAPMAGFVAAPYYERTSDEPIFEQAWETVKAKQDQGSYKTGTSLPIGGIRLRGSRSKQCA